MFDLESLNINSLPSVALEDRLLLPARPSVYFVTDNQNVIQYIGKSLNTKSRWTKHSKLKELPSLEGIRISYLLLPEHELAFVEAKLIEYFNPPLNVVVKATKKMKPPVANSLPELEDKDRNSYYRYAKFAIEYKNNNFEPLKRVLTRAEQQAIAIHALLNDGEWHTASEIAAHIGISSHRHVQNIMQALKAGFAIASGQQGYCIPQKHTILIA